jgi:DHA3 family tetracycline resistance protein-like MFS transporter
VPDTHPGRDAVRAATLTYLMLSGAGSLFFSAIVTVNLLYHVETVGLSPLQLVLVGTTLETAIVLFEIPTGVVADLVSRRRSILIGLALTGVGFMVEGSFPTFVAIMLAQGLWGIGYTFTSGATEAWITDEVGEDAVGHVMLRGNQAELGGSIAGVLLGTGLGLIHIQLPIVLGGAGYVALAALLLRVMPETSFHPTPRKDRSTWHHMREIARDGFAIARSRPVVRVLLLTSFLVGLSSEAFDRLWTRHLIDTFAFPDLPGDGDLVLWFGTIHMVGLILSLLAAEALKRFHPESLGPGTPTKLLASLAAGRVATTILFALAGWLWLALGALWIRGLLGSVTHPIGAAWMNRNIEPRTRATVISFREQVASLGEIGGGPPLGAVGSRFGVPAAMIGTAIVFAPAVATYLRASHLRDHAGTEAPSVREPASGEVA